MWLPHLPCRCDFLPTHQPTTIMISSRPTKPALVWWLVSGWVGDGCKIQIRCQTEMYVPVGKPNPTIGCYPDGLHDADILDVYLGMYLSPEVRYLHRQPDRHRKAVDAVGNACMCVCVSHPVNVGFQLSKGPFATLVSLLIPFPVCCHQFCFVTIT